MLQIDEQFDFLKIQLCTFGLDPMDWKILWDSPQRLIIENCGDKSFQMIGSLSKDQQTWESISLLE